eukprot:GHVS01107742.1.p1 GENE.GHVS01107742.1~~GHVS01107742.1.p1  ORF type:complete len:356 (+),score=51.36 GHVS01107742.1:569-1636(+)
MNGPYQLYELPKHAMRLKSSAINKIMNQLNNNSKAGPATKTITEGSRQRYMDVVNRLTDENTDDSAENSNDRIRRPGLQLYNQMLQFASVGVKRWISLKHPQQHKTDENSLHVTFLLHWNEPLQQAELLAHISALRSIAETVQVDVMSGRRKCPTIKDSQWFFERQSILSVMSPESDETILMEQQQQSTTKDYDTPLPQLREQLLTEGLSSNFFMICNDHTVVDGQLADSVMTAADDKVLPGTIRQCVLDICSRLGIKVTMQSPTVGDIMDSRRCRGCFITSTSRGARLIHKVVIHKVRDDSNNTSPDGVPVNNPVNVVSFTYGSEVDCVGRLISAEVKRDMVKHCVQLDNTDYE